MRYAEVEMVRVFTALLVASTIASCATEPLPTGQTASVGTVDRGYLREARSLPDRGDGFRRLRPGEGTRFGTATLIGAIERASQQVAAAFPGGYPLRVGDLSSPRGGAHARHRTHRAGRDADLLFFTRDSGGLPAQSPAWLPFDGFGLATLRGRVFRFDEARNWHLVRTLVMDPAARVKWIFCSRELKARLLRYAARHDPSPRAVARATWILHEPGRGDPHDDHFHLRVGCTEAERSLGCREQAPHWPWLTDTARKDASQARAPAGDAQLLQWLVAEEHVDQRRDIARSGLGVAAEPSAVAAR